MIFSKTLGYALQTVIYLGNQPPKKPILQKDISNDLDIPHHYLGKILQPLTKNGIVNSKTGATGGFFLTKSPNKIALNDIIAIFDGADCLDNCILGFPGCGDETPCPVHSEWGAAKTILLKLIKDHSIAELGSEIGPKLDYIKMLKNSKQLKS